MLTLRTLKELIDTPKRGEKLGKESDEQYNRLREGKEQEDDRSRVCK